MKLKGKQLYLASQSPRRHQLLSLAEIPFTPISVSVEETFPKEMEVRHVPLFLARKKMDAAWPLVGNENAVLLTADTVVISKGGLIGKPESEQDALEILRQLSGSTHEVITGVALKSSAQTTYFEELTQVVFKPLTDEEISFYIQRFRPFDKAGAYAIQEWIGVVGIEKIVGDYYNVMGLPVQRIYTALKAFMAEGGTEIPRG